MDGPSRPEKSRSWHPLAQCLLIGAGAGLVAAALIAPMMFLTELRRDDALEGILGSLVFCTIFGATVGVVFWGFRYPLPSLLKYITGASTAADQPKMTSRASLLRSILRVSLSLIITGIGFGVTVVVVFNFVMGVLMVAEEGLMTAFREVNDGGLIMATRLGLAGAWERVRMEGPGLVRQTWEMALFAGIPAGPIFWVVLLFLFRERRRD